MGLKRNTATRLLFRCDTSRAVPWEIHPPTVLKPGSIVMEVKTAPCLLSVSPASLATQLDILVRAGEGGPCMATVTTASADEYTHE